MTNVAKLHAELVAAGVPLTGCDSAGVIIMTDASRWTPGVGGDRGLAVTWAGQCASVLASHADTPTQMQALLAVQVDTRVALALSLLLANQQGAITATASQLSWARGVILASAQAAQGIIP